MVELANDRARITAEILPNHKWATRKGLNSLNNMPWFSLGCLRLERLSENGCTAWVISVLSVYVAFDPVWVVAVQLALVVSTPGGESCWIVHGEFERCG